MTNKCFRCEVEFDNWAAYHTHQLTNTCFKKIVPTKTTNRTKAEIVAEYEYAHFRAFIS